MSARANGMLTNCLKSVRSIAEPTGKPHLSSAARMLLEEAFTSVLYAADASFSWRAEHSWASLIDLVPLNCHTRC